MVQQKSLVTGDKPEIVVDEANGDFRLMGWERAEVLVKVEGDLTLQQSDDQVVHLRCDGDAVVRIPIGANLTMNQAHGDARIKSINGRVHLGDMSGDLAVRHVGEISLNSHTGDVSIKHVAGDLSVATINGDFTLHDAHNIQIDNVAGDLSVRGIQGNAMIGNTSGDVSIESAQGNIAIGNSSGDVSVASVQGNVAIGDTGSDLSVSGVQGNVTLGSTGGDASLQGVHGQVNTGHISGDLTAQAVYSITAEASGDATVALVNPVGNSTVKTSGDITARFAPNANVSVNITSAASSITVSAPGGARTIEESTYVLKLGNGDVQMALDADGDVSVMSDAPENAGRRADAGSSPFDFDFNFDFDPGLGALSGLGDRIAQRARETAERATAEVQAKVQAKVERATRKAEEQAQRVERRFGWSSRHARNDEGRRPPTPPAPPRPAPIPPQQDPVSDEERMMILRMLEQKKITAAQAEQLLSALTGKGA